MTSPDRIAEIAKDHASMPAKAFEPKFAPEYLSEAHKDRGDLLQALAASEARVKELEARHKGLHADDIRPGLAAQVQFNNELNRAAKKGTP